LCSPWCVFWNSKLTKNRNQGLNMTKINIILTFASALLFTACATYNPQYRNETENSNSEITSAQDIDQTFYLIGNAGNDSETSQTMQAFGNYIADNNSKDSYILFL